MITQTLKLNKPIFHDTLLYFSSLFNKFSSTSLDKSHNSAMRSKSPKKYIPAIIIIVAAAITVFAIVRLLGRIRPSAAASSNSRVTVQGAKATMDINKEFTFPIKDSAGKKITDLKFSVESTELRNEIIVKGSRATAVEGRTFLILNMRIMSTFTKALQINTQDYFRLTVNGNESDLLAPDIHNDPLIIQPTSTKVTRLGFAINDTDKNIVLQVGEIGGEKTKVELNLQ